MARTSYPARRLIDLPDLFSWEPFPARSTVAAENRMRVEQYREDGDIVVRAEMPGLDVDNDLEITIEDDVIRIAAERREEKTSEEDGTYRSEFVYGSFERSFRLPKDVDAERISADYDKGILEVRLPVVEPEAEQPRKIEVQKKP